MSERDKTSATKWSQMSKISQYCQLSKWKQNLFVKLLGVYSILTYEISWKLNSENFAWEKLFLEEKIRHRHTHVLRVKYFQAHSFAKGRGHQAVLAKWKKQCHSHTHTHTCMLMLTLKIRAIFNSTKWQGRERKQHSDSMYHSLTMTGTRAIKIA